MFNNLIESSSHAKEFKRRGSFLLFTTATYVVLFAITGVLSIYAYDARLGQQNLELVVLLPPTELAPDPQPAAPVERPQVTRDNNQSNIPSREIAMATVDTPERPPTEVSTTPNRNLPVPPGIYRIGPDYNPPGLPAGPANSTGGGGSRQVIPSRPIEIEEPPPAPEQPKVPKIVSKGVITGQAIALPQPAYPALARQARVQGIVSVQVLIDEEGTVISATPVGGHPMLRGAAQQAALRARFRPTLLSNQPVKVSGVITYDFKLGY